MALTGNPWLQIPAADYLGHMGSPQVGQLQALSALFRDAVAEVRPASLLLLGCATGNGLEHVDPSVTSRVVAVDINPDYLARLLEQYREPGFELDGLCADLSTHAFEPDSFDLVHAGLVLEYVDWRAALPALARTVRPGGALSAVLQLPSASIATVTPTGFASLRTLEPLFQFVDPSELVGAASTCGLRLALRRTHPLDSGKAFEVLRFQRG